jgi:TRAP-type mannitol/chloroaromatic compound transport system permease small subunit
MIAIADRINRYAAYLAAAMLVVLVMLVVYDALMRYLFTSGSIALQELEWHLFDGVILLGIGYTLAKNRHVRVDIFYERFSPRVRMGIDMFGLLFFIIPFSALIIYIGCDFVMLSFHQMEASSNPGGLPYRFIVKALMPLSFVLLALQALGEVLRIFKKARS